jgi:putative restriction endonuclease
VGEQDINPALEPYVRRFSRLRSDAIPGRWPESTRYRSPYKPFILLSVIDLISQGIIRANFVRLDAALIDAFDLYCAKVLGLEKRGNPVLPFGALQSDGFWHLAPAPGQEKALQARPQLRTMRQLEQMALGATFDDALFSLLLDRVSRDVLRSVLLNTCFSSAAQAKLSEVSAIATQSIEYGRELADRAKRRFKMEDVPPAEERYYTESRTIAFRRFVIQAYDFTCAACGIRVVTPEGRTAVTAAHIVPFSVSHNDDPRNGLALCGVHHWALDEGLIAVDQDYAILASPLLRREDGGNQLLLSLSGRHIGLPAQQTYWPARSALSWHQRNLFRSTTPPHLL